MISLWSNTRILRKSSQLMKYSFENINNCSHQKTVHIGAIFRKLKFDVKIKVGKYDYSFTLRNFFDFHKIRKKLLKIFKATNQNHDSCQSPIF